MGASGRPLKFPQSFIDEVRAAADIVTVISDTVSLRKAGNSYKGLCPFHGEKTPSFNVMRTRGFFHCFGCGVGGDVFKFVELQEKVGFQEAVRHLAARFGIPIPEVEATASSAKARPSARRSSRSTRSRSPISASSSPRRPARRWREYLAQGSRPHAGDDRPTADRLGAAVARRAASAPAEGGLHTRCSS